MSTFKKIDGGLYAIEFSEEEKQESLKKVKQHQEENEDSLLKELRIIYFNK